MSSRCIFVNRPARLGVLLSNVLFMSAADRGWRTEVGMRARSALICGAVAVAALAYPGVAAAASGPSAGANVRVTVDDGSQGAYQSADQLSGGTYTDAVLTRCGQDRRMQNEPTLAIDPRDPSVGASGSNDYFAVPPARENL